MAGQQPSPKTSDDGLPPLPEPIITTAEFQIRPYHASDVFRMAMLLDNPKIARFMGDPFPQPFTPVDAIGFIDSVSEPGSNTYAYGIYLPHPSVSPPSPKSPPPSSPSDYTELVGGVGIRASNSDTECRTWHLNTWLGEKYWGKGIMTEAVTLFTRWAFRVIPVETLTRIEEFVHENNEAHKRVMTMAGFWHEGVRRKAMYKKGETLDMHMFGLLREDLGSLP